MEPLRPHAFPSLSDLGNIATIAGFLVVALGGVARFIPRVRRYLIRWRALRWLATKKDLEAIEANRNAEQAKKEEYEAKKEADFSFEMRWESGDVILITRNKGLCRARNIEVFGLKSPRYWGTDADGNAVPYTQIAECGTLRPGDEFRSGPFDNQSWQIEGGTSPAGRWQLEASWDDGRGRQEHESFIAHNA